MTEFLDWLRHGPGQPLAATTVMVVWVGLVLVLIHRHDKKD